MMATREAVALAVVPMPKTMTSQHQQCGAAAFSAMHSSAVPTLQDWIQPIAVMVAKDLEIQLVK